MQKKKWIALNTQSSWQSWRSQNDALNIYYKIHMNKFSFKKCRILKKKRHFQEAWLLIHDVNIYLLSNDMPAAVVV